MFLQLICQKNLAICPDVFHHIDFEDYIPVVQKKLSIMMTMVMMTE